MIASLLYKMGAYFGQYFGNLFPKVREDQNKKKGLRRKSVLILDTITGICPQKQVKTKKKVFAANSNWFWETQTEGFGLDRLFICHKMVGLSMRKSTSQKHLTGHTKQLHDQMWPAGHGLGIPDLNYTKPLDANA